MATERTNYTSKLAIGKLYIAVTGSTDPAHYLGFFSSFISAVRGALIRKYESGVEHYEDIPGLLNTILKHIVYQWTAQGLPKEYQAEIDKRISEIFPTNAMLKYGLELHRDILFCDDLRKRWIQANGIYIASPSSWAVSNAILAPALDQILEIVERHDLMMIPKEASFNIDEGGSIDYGAIQQAMKSRVTTGGD
jgi:hypothetical protein